MTIIVRKIVFGVVAAAVVGTLFDSRSCQNHHRLCGGGGVVDGAVAMSREVECLPEAPEVCIGEKTMSSPSPGMMCSDPDDPNSCTAVQSGGYTWSFVFVTTVTDTTDTTAAAIEPGLETIDVFIDDDLTTCGVLVGTESCTRCSAEGCKARGVQYDCTNLEHGRASADGDCESLEPFLYPFELLVPEEVTDTNADSVDLVVVDESPPATNTEEGAGSPTTPTDGDVASSSADDSNVAAFSANDADAIDSSANNNNIIVPKGIASCWILVGTLLVSVMM